VVGEIIRTYARSFAARDSFVGADARLLFSTMQIAYLAVLNQVCLVRSFEPARELESLYDRAMNGG